jgi:phage shock protein PspC (stress-responsive transcriptional regulator)
MNDSSPRREPEVETASHEADAGTPKPARPRLVRSRRDRKIAGVAAGVADHLNVDPILIRIAFVVSVFAGGLGILLYIAGWFLIPEEGDREPIGEPVLERLRHAPWLAVALFVLGGTLLISELSAWDGGVIFWALALIGVGWLIYQDEPMRGRRTKDEPPTSPRDEPPPAPGSPPPPGAVTTRSAGGLPAPAPPATWERPQRPRSFLGRYTLGAILVVVGGAALFDDAGVFTLEAGQYPALALVVLGAGLLVGTFWGRARGLILLGLLVAPFAWAAALVDVPLEGGYGPRFYAPVSASSVADEYHLIGGEMLIDLTDLEWGAEPVDIDATVAFGKLELIVPDGVDVRFHGSAGVGQVEFFDDQRDGVDVDVDSSRAGSPSSGRLILDMRTSFGKVEVAGSSADLER